MGEVISGKNPEPEPALKPSERVRLAELEAEVRELRMENEFLKSRSRLNEEGIVYSVGLVAYRIREMGLAATQPRAYKRTIVADEHARSGVGFRYYVSAHWLRLAVFGHDYRSGHPYGRRLAAA